MKKIIFNKANAKQLGRTLVENDTLKLILSGTGCEFTFIGKKLQLILGCDKTALANGCSCNLPRVAVLVNDKFVLKKVIDKPKELVTVLDVNSVQSVNVKIIKLSEAAFSIAEVYPAEICDDEEIQPVSSKQLKIEFIGDSITCGYGVDDGNTDSEFSTCVENVMKSYSYLTANNLNADYSMFSASGYGIISGYTADGTRNLPERIPPFYESYGFSHCTLDENVLPHTVPWNFSNFVPDVIVINLGTNDQSFCLDDKEKHQEFEDSYLKFLKKVRRNNPNAVIFCMLGIMGATLFPSIVNACKRFTDETGDINIYTLELDQQDGSLGYSSKWHPSEDTHRCQAEKISEYIRKTLKL